MKRPLEQDYTSLVAYTRVLEEYCDALAQPDQEPVACIWEKNDGYKSLEWGGLEEDEIQEIGLKSYTPLYTHLTQRTWVGLTDEDIALIEWESLVTKKDCVQAIEAKLKEKNHV
jgi:hypothetical protein